MKTNILKPLLGGICLATMLMAAGSANATPIYYFFDVLVANSASQASIVETQIRMGVEAGGSGGVNFLFENLGPNNSAITAVYFQSPPPALLPPNPITSWSSGVKFSTDNTGTPTTPGGSIPWNGTQWLADNDPGNANAVQPSEWINFFFSGANYGDVITALNAGTWHTALHVQSIGLTGGSEWAQTTGTGGGPTPPGVPDGGTTVALLGSALVGLSFLRSKFSKS